jgi:hypothetical protein
VAPLLGDVIAVPLLGDVIVVPLLGVVDGCFCVDDFGVVGSKFGILKRTLTFNLFIMGSRHPRTGSGS